ncbi:MAG: polysaccharide biosynthesis C-terminal domain-containing protein, partial [Planctomycetales bacterium]|nr:polysaccharide biosynthesis C-terminal domain-containing protein [Planctomycetales bacterium]
AFATAFNFLTELLTALKKIRVVSFMQFANSLVFAAIGLLLIGVWRLSTEGVVIAYGAACGTTSIVAMMIVVRGWGVVPPAAQEMSHRDLWSKLMPFAAWMWLTNLLSNMFTAADRYMIVHLSHTDARGACELVGQYHSSRIVPELMVAVAVLISNAALPYLSNDWETGRRSRVSLHQNRVLKLYAIGMTGGSLVLMMVAPWLFHYAMGGKYATGLSVLPWTIMGCIWAGLILVAQNYLWCAERARVASFSLLAGLIINVVLNAWMLPRWGLVGAILATAIANAFTLAAVVYMSCKQGMTLEPTTVFALTLPTILGLGIAQATVVFTLILFLGFSRNWLISAEDWQWIRQQIADRVPSRNMQTTVIGRLQQKTT